MGIRIPINYKKYTGIILLELEKRGIDPEDFNIFGEIIGAQGRLDIIYNSKLITMISETEAENDEIEEEELPFDKRAILHYKLSKNNPKGVLLSMNKK